MASSEELAQALRDATIQLYQAGNLAELTVRRVRTEAEKQLGLEAGFFKNDPEWGDKSKKLIREEVVCSMRFLYLHTL